MRENRKIFWMFQISFWMAYFLYNVFVVHHSSFIRDEINPVILIVYLVLMCFFGIPLTLIAARLYNAINFRRLPMYLLFTAVVVISFYLANVWFLEILLLDKIFNELMAFSGISSVSFIPLKMPYYLWEVFFAFLLLVAWSAIYLFLRLWRDWTQQKFEIEKVNLQLENAQLRMLRSQISPHFLFNSLCSLRALIRVDAVGAEKMLSKISDFLRYSLIQKDQWDVPLHEEIKAMKNYLSIEKVRFKKNLQVEYDIDSSAEDFPIPGFILHPIVENSVKYGMAGGKAPLRILIRAEKTENKLFVEVVNSGKWQTEDMKHEASGTGTGLETVRGRLQTLYPGRHALTITEEDGNVKVTMEFEQPGDSINE